MKGQTVSDISEMKRLDRECRKEIANNRRARESSSLQAEMLDVLMHAEADLILNMRTTPRGNMEYKQAAHTITRIRAVIERATA